MHDTFTDWIDQDTLENLNITHLAESFSTAKPFPYLVIENFLSEEKQQVLLTAIKEEPFLEKFSDLFSFKQTHDLSGTSVAVLKEFRSFLSSKPFLHLIEKITDLELTEGIIDLHGSLYEKADYLLCHDDDLQGRKIAFMFYLSDLDKGDGGLLELYDEHEGDAGEIKERVVPKKGSLAFFAIDGHPYHAVSEIIKDKQRYAIAGWFHG